MSVSKNRSRLLFAALLFFICSVIVLSGLRFALFEVFRSPELTFTDFLPAFITGFKVDAKWLSILFLPAWILTAMSLWRGAFRKTAIVLAAAALAVMVTLDLVNFGFFGFYRTPISPIVFGLFQDDTKAIIVTIVNDWPVFRYLGVLFLLTALPVVTVFGLVRFFPKRDVLNGLTAAIVYALLTLMLAGAVRGSFGTFPLRLQDFSVSPNPFINATVPNGAAALYEAVKGRKALQLDGPPEIALKEMGFDSEADALAVLKNGQEPAGMTPAALQPHVVLAVMESMGRDFFEAHKPGVNDMLGRLADELPHGTVFLNGISIENGTFPSLEGLLFDSPYTPITQSRYGGKTFLFSKALLFKKAGWKTVFLTAGPEGWRQMDVNFPRHGFDEVIGSAAIRARFPQAETLTWGIGDEWMFRTAEALIEEADRRGERLFIVMLSASNHGPHRVPDATPLNPVSADALPPVIVTERSKLNTEELRTYQYAADALGGFVGRLRADSSAPGRREVLIAATGDHNCRQKYRPEGDWHHSYGVPLIFWLPESLKQLGPVADTSAFVGHRDIIPTLAGIVFGRKPALHEGRNLFSRDRRDLVLSYIGVSPKGFAVGRGGLVMLEGASFTCYRLENDRFVPETPCSPERTALGNAARAQRALAGFIVRSGLVSEP